MQVDDKESKKLEINSINPWDTSTRDSLLKKISPLMKKFDVRCFNTLLSTCLNLTHLTNIQFPYASLNTFQGYHSSTKPYTGKVALSTLKNSSRNKVIELGYTLFSLIIFII